MGGNPRNGRQWSLCPGGDPAEGGCGCGRHLPAAARSAAAGRGPHPTRAQLGQPAHRLLRHQPGTAIPSGKRLQFP